MASGSTFKFDQNHFYPKNVLDVRMICNNSRANSFSDVEGAAAVVELCDK